MNSKITKLADLGGFAVGEEYRDRSVAEETVLELLSDLADNLGDEIHADRVEGNCCVVCTKENGDSVLVFPAMELPGAEAAGEMLAGRSCGETVSTQLAGEPVTLTVKQILTRVSAPQDDSLADRAQIEGVTNLEQLKEHLRQNEIHKKTKAFVKELSMAMLSYLEDESEAEIDPEEMDTWALEHAETAYQENIAAGIDLRFTPEGEMLTEEQVMEMLKEDMIRQFKTKLVIDAVCAERGYEPDPANYMAMMPSLPEGIEGFEADPAEEDAMLEQLKENDCYLFVLDILNKRAEEVLE